MSNWGDAFVIAMRSVVSAVPGLPTQRLWANRGDQLNATQPAVDDALIAMDSAPRECGPDAWLRAQAAYRVVLYVPAGGDIHAITSLAGALESAFWSAELSVLGNPLEVHRVRIGPPSEGDSVYALPVVISTSFDHPPTTEG